MELDKNDKQWLRSYENQLLAELYIAYLEARSGGKRKTQDEQEFEVDLFKNLVKLRDELVSKTYLPSGGEAHVIVKPVRREIFAAKFRDRVAHHYIYDKIYDWWDRHFLYDSYSCREGKGTLVGIKRLSSRLLKATQNGKKEAYIMKLDLQGYFMSINRKKLYEKVVWGLDRQYEDRLDTAEYEVLKYAIRVTIMDDPVPKARLRGYPEKWKKLPKTKSLLYQPPGVGLVIGNVTSQVFSNVFLDSLDRFIRFTLGYKYMGRYVDDFYIIIPKEDYRKIGWILSEVRRFLKVMGLTLHPDKIYVQEAKKGVQFLGGIVHAGYVYPAARVKKNYRKAISDYINGKIPVDSLISYHGHVLHFAHTKMEKKFFRALWSLRGERGDERNPPTILL